MRANLSLFLLAFLFTQSFCKSLFAQQGQPEVMSTANGKFIQHPMAKKGLRLIDRDGSYYYETTKTSAKDETSIVRLGAISPAPSVISADGQTTYKTMYGSGNPFVMMYDYEWKPLKRFGSLGLVAGMGFFTAQGSGRFNCVGDPLCGTEAEEKYTFYASPLSLGAVYRFQYSDRQWISPAVSGGVTYFALAEFRDDGKSPSVVGTPAAYGAGSLMFNLSQIDKDLGFKLDAEYGIHTMWLNFEIRQIQSSNKDLDFSGTMLTAGVTVDY
jgi:hypothetical protein